MSSSGSNGGGPEFDLPDEILSVIPTDPYEQLDLARKITSMAIASRVSKLESDTSCMRQKLHEKERVVVELEEKVLRLERAHRDADSRLKAALDENMKLSNERDSLSMTVKKLSRDLVKLETFKRQLMQSLNDDNSSHVETIDSGTYNQLNPKLSLENGANGYGSHQSFNGTADFGNSMGENSRHAVQKFTISPYITPRLTPSGTPKIISTAGSPRTYSSAGSPQRTSGATSPIKPQHEGGNIMSSWYPSSQQSSAANSPPRGRSLPGRPPRIDGKEFFRQARTRLSYEQFSAFLANIKELNAQKQTREETLRNAEQIFGTDNKDLYLSFQGLLNRKVH